ncbi:hypothetical protein [Catelliglobosispora koreensis]|uniref:hypothetical protein n=1 Tax=Catelliglobosispora koreensis TaxID=129052 RepID=UPI00036C2F07|nr:hypothetical protein [Catelliglobosispora koreensis]
MGLRTRATLAVVAVAASLGACASKPQQLPDIAAEMTAKQHDIPTHYVAGNAEPGVTFGPYEGRSMEMHFACLGGGRMTLAGGQKGHEGLIAINCTGERTGGQFNLARSKHNFVTPTFEGAVTAWVVVVTQPPEK